MDPQYIPPPPPGLAAIWMQRPAPIPNCPGGLEYLTQLNQVQVHQLPSLLEAFIGWETNNKYVLKNSLGQQFLYAFEETGTCMRLICGTRRGFTIHIVDNLNQEVMIIRREFKCCAGCSWCAGCCDCCAFEVMVEAPPGNLIGYIKQKGSFWKARYDIMDESDNVILKIEGPCCTFDGPLCPCENEFKVLADGDTQIGSIMKKYTGVVKECFTKADNFAITFPNDLSVKAKAILIGALFLIVIYLFY